MYLKESLQAVFVLYPHTRLIKLKEHTMQGIPGLHLSLDGWTPKLLHQKYWLGERVYEV